MNLLMLLAFLAGAAIAIQANLNAQLGVLLKNSMLGTAIAFFTACVFSIGMLLVTTKHYPDVQQVKNIPIYFWFSGGALSALGVGLFYYLIPKMGVGSMMSYALTGQMLAAALTSHFGWLSLPTTPLNGQKLCGIVALIFGVILMNGKSNYGA